MYWFKQQEASQCAQEGKDTVANVFLKFSLFSKSPWARILQVVCNIVTATETHHLLSVKLCEHSDQPLSSQRGWSAATFDSGTYKGKNNVDL